MVKNVELLDKLVRKFNKVETTYNKYNLSNCIYENKVEIEARCSYIKKKIELGMDLENEIEKLVKKSFTTGQAKKEVIENFYIDLFVYRMILLEKYGIDYYKEYSSLLHNVLTYIFKHKDDEVINFKQVIALSVNTQEVLKNILPEYMFNKIKFE